MVRGTEGKCRNKKNVYIKEHPVDEGSAMRIARDSAVCCRNADNSVSLSCNGCQIG